MNMSDEDANEQFEEQVNELLANTLEMKRALKIYSNKEHNNKSTLISLNKTNETTSEHKNSYR